MKQWATIVLGAMLLAGCASSAERAAEAARKQRLVETNVELAANYLRRQQWESASERLVKALDIDPASPQANNMMALLQWQMKDYSAAEKYFTIALHRTDDPEIQNNYGAFLCERGLVDQAVIWFKKAIAHPLYKTPAEANQNAGVCVMKKSAPAEAEPFFREAIRINPALGPSLYYLAKIHHDRKDYLAARGIMQRYFEGPDETPEALLLAVRVERALGNKNKEASYALRLRGKFPDSSEAQQLNPGKVRR